MARRNARRRPTRKPRSRARSKRVPAWAWFGAGLGCCLLGLTLYQLTSQSPQSAPPSARATGAPQANADKTLTFKFYDTLRQFSVKVDPAEDRSAGPSSEPVSTASRAPREPADTAGAASRQQPQPSYFLQAGSFKQREQAEKRRIELLLLNTDANITQVKHNGSAWFRVRTGPYDSAQQVAGIRTKLLNEGIDTMVTRR